MAFAWRYSSCENASRSCCRPGVERFLRGAAIVEAAADLLVIPLPQCGAVAVAAQRRIADRGAIALARDEIDCGEKTPGVPSLVRRDGAEHLPRLRRRRAPREEKIGPPVGELLADEALQHLQRLQRRRAHAAGVRLRARERQLGVPLGGAQTVAGRVGSHRRRGTDVGIGVQRRIHPLPDARTAPVIVCGVLRRGQLVFHRSVPPRFSSLSYAGRARHFSLIFFAKAGKLYSVLIFRVIFCGESGKMWHLQLSVSPESGILQINSRASRRNFHVRAQEHMLHRLHAGDR